MRPVRKFSLLVYCICLELITSSAIPSKRLLIGQDVGCETDILKTYKDDVTIRSSSELFHDDNTHDYSASRGRLDLTQTTSSDGVTRMGGWSSNFNDVRQFIEIETKTDFNFTGVITQGKNGCCQEWVTSYRILFSHDCTSWHVLDGPNGAIFQGNSDEDTKVQHKFPKPVVARCIRVNPIRFNNHISMRIGLIGQPLIQGSITCSNPQTQHSTQASTSTSVSSHCQSSPCQNNGKCHDVADTFICACGMSADGRFVYTGKLCELSLQVARTLQSTVPSTTWLHIPG